VTSTAASSIAAKCVRVYVETCCNRGARVQTQEGSLTRHGGVSVQLDGVRVIFKKCGIYPFLPVNEPDLSNLLEAMVHKSPYECQSALKVKNRYLDEAVTPSPPPAPSRLFSHCHVFAPFACQLTAGKQS